MLVACRVGIQMAHMGRAYHQYGTNLGTYSNRRDIDIFGMAVDIASNNSSDSFGIHIVSTDCDSKK